ncbi:hypothetical protein CPB85DRAFT_1289587 [Mucidula mucida]|nr:hypothetical protein CPB85DRAFT_1289587 [Mucidula mucida]
MRMFYHKAGTNRDPQDDLWVSRDIKAGSEINPTRLSNVFANVLPRYFTSRLVAVEPGQFIPFQSEIDCGEFMIDYVSVLNIEFDMLLRSLLSPTWKPSAQELRREYDREKTKETAVSRLFSNCISDTSEFVLRLPVTETVFDVASGIRTFFRLLGQQRYFEQLPSVLVIQLGRWVFDSKATGTRKEFRPIRVDTIVDVPPELIATYGRNPFNSKYKLVGVVYHHGSSAVTGHYTADVAHPGRGIDYHRAREEDDVRPWFRMNDGMVSAAPRDDIRSLRRPSVTNPPSHKTPYLLFYEQI